ncbi:MAG: hypothetical protein C4527_18340 [Candidatus Omnitrophota bacterium]|nr:MAG: hypothetical protein C4527_18340 [Candidatus Omnitrophota bacterium]
MIQTTNVWKILFVGFLLLGNLPPSMAQQNDLVFLHHSCGENWLNDGLRSVLDAKDYIDEVNDIYYGDVLTPDSGRPASLGDVAGDHTNMNHWILWFNDYLEGIRKFDAASGKNTIIMFKSCYPLSHVDSDGSEPGNPFSEDQTVANYRSVFRHSTDSNGMMRDP